MPSDALSDEKMIEPAKCYKAPFLLQGEIQSSGEENILTYSLLKNGTVKHRSRNNAWYRSRR
jgi:hypothetical protein